MADRSASGPRRSAASRQVRATRERLDADRYDLLTAALIGAAVGATAMLLVRRPSARKVVRPLAGLAVQELGRRALAAGTGALGSRAVERAGRAAMPVLEDAAEQLGDYVRTARSAIDSFLADEVRDIRKAIRRGRKKAGL